MCGEKRRLTRELMTDSASCLPGVHFQRIFPGAFHRLRLEPGRKETGATLCGNVSGCSGHRQKIPFPLFFSVSSLQTPPRGRAQPALAQPLPAVKKRPAAPSPPRGGAGGRSSLSYRDGNNKEREGVPGVRGWTRPGNCAGSPETLPVCCDPSWAPGQGGFCPSALVLR